MQVLDALAWTTLPEHIKVVRLANKLARSGNKHPARCIITDAVRETYPERGRLGSMTDLVEAEFERQKPIVAKRIKAQKGLSGVSESYLARQNAITIEAVRLAYNKCNYRRAQSSWAGGDHDVDIGIGFASAGGKSIRVWSSNGKWSGNDSVHYITVPKLWRKNVLSVCDGTIEHDGKTCLVLTVDGKRFEIVKQGRGFDLNSEWVRRG